MIGPPPRNPDVDERDVHLTVRGSIIGVGLVIAATLGLIAVAAAVAAVLLAVATGSVAPLLLPLGVAGAFLVALRRLNPLTLTSRSTLLTPTVLLALGPFTLSFDAVAFVESIWVAALSAGVGLVIGALQEARRSPLGAVGLAVVVALFTLLPAAAV